MKFLPFSKDLAVPLDVVTQRIAALGISGSGKTYAATKLVEDAIHAGAQVVIIDTVGNWWGLRLAASGKMPAIAIPILGGDHADVPLEPMQGKLTAITAAESRASMDPAGGGFNNYVSKLNATSLIRKHGDRILAAELLLG